MKELKKITDPVLRNDVAHLCQTGLIDQFEPGCGILVTGATGLLGSLIVKSLICSNHNLRVVALARSNEKATAVFGDMLTNPNLSLHFSDVTEPLNIPDNIHYIIHAASPTDSRFFVERPVETIFTALNGTRNVLELARQKQVKKAVYLSSLEVYGVPCNHNETICETDYGTIDPTKVRSSYSEGKRMAECICASYYAEYGVPVTIARLTQILGAGIEYHNNRVFAQFARCAIEGRDIVLHTQGNTVRSYCYSTDAVNAIFTLLLHGEPGEAYNITNMDTAVSIRQLAELVCAQIPEQRIQVCVDVPDDLSTFGYNPEVVIRLNSEKMQSLGWTPSIDLPGMLTRLIGSMQYSKDHI